ncbi:hypothetical protein BU16DRAFT_621864 [Lophium mytilinum]|uniref:Uncharacterized protein n=1 Tax=Lophium mytilinum TaxID=390894 RepID=A0A6A6QEX2_9PEZI|nr:hypothetical protein BU16DRAFT_621864 [Lophium mytilinum]
MEAASTAKTIKTSSMPPARVFIPNAALPASGAKTSASPKSALSASSPPPSLHKLEAVAKTPHLARTVKSIAIEIPIQHASDYLQAKLPEACRNAVEVHAPFTPAARLGAAARGMGRWQPERETEVLTYIFWEDTDFFRRLRSAGCREDWLERKIVQCWEKMEWEGRNEGWRERICGQIDEMGFENLGRVVKYRRGHRNVPDWCY